MMESFADLGEMDISLIVDSLVQLKQARNAGAYGHLGAKVFGGNTRCSEFEVMTGVSLGERGVATKPFMSDKNHSQGS